MGANNRNEDNVEELYPFGETQASLIVEEEGDGPTLVGMARGLAHGCITHPISAVVFFAGDFLRILSPKTEPLGRKVIAIGEDIHNLL